jgi:hypothetical protein
MRAKGKAEIKIKIMLIFITALGATFLKTKELLKKEMVAVQIAHQKQNF